MQKAGSSSSKIIKKQNFNINKIATDIIDEFYILYSHYNENKLQKIFKNWKKYCDTINKNVIVVTTTKKLKGKVTGIDKECNLLLKVKNNKIVKVIEGDTNIRY